MAHEMNERTHRKNEVRDWHLSFYSLLPLKNNNSSVTVIRVEVKNVVLKDSFSSLVFCRQGENE